MTFDSVLHVLLAGALGWAVARIRNQREQMRGMMGLIAKQEEVIRSLHAMIDWAPPLPSFLQKDTTPPRQEPN